MPQLLQQFCVGLDGQERKTQKAFAISTVAQKIRYLNRTPSHLLNSAKWR